MSTLYHSQYWANALSLLGSGSDIESLSRSIANVFYRAGIIERRSAENVNPAPAWRFA